MSHRGDAARREPPSRLQQHTEARAKGPRGSASEAHPLHKLKQAALFPLAIVLGWSAALPIAPYLERGAPELLTLRSLEVAGADHLDDQRLRELARLRPGTPLRRIDREAVRGRLLAHPWVAEAEVGIALPGRVVIRLTERRAAARLRGAKGDDEGADWWIDETGAPFADVVDGSTHAVPLLIADASGRPKMGERSAALASALATLEGLRGGGLGIAQWHMGGIAGTSVAPVALLRGFDVPVIFGWGDPHRQLSRLARALGRSEIREAAAIDLRFRHQVLFRPASSEVGDMGKWTHPDG